MLPCRRLLAVAATALALGACDSAGDEATLRISLGSALQALTVEAITIDRYELDVACSDGTVSTFDGEVAPDGSFSAEVPNCPQATIRFRGLTSARVPALDGRVAAVIRAPSTDVTVPVRRVGRVTILNDDDYTAVCKVFVANAPEYDAVFELTPGSSRTEVLPVNGSQLVCAAADTCGTLTTCDLSGPLATTRAVAVPFGGESTLSLANLTNSLVFTVAPPSPLLAGIPWAPFTVTVVDERGVPVTRGDITVSLVAESSTANGGFQNGIQQTVGGAASFPFVTFTTAGALTMRATADVDGVLLRTDPITLTIVPDATASLRLVGPATAIAGVPFDLTVNGSDRYGNATNPPTAIVLDSTDPQAVGRIVDAVGLPIDVLAVATATTAQAAGMTFELRTAGVQSINARSTQDPSIAGTLTVEVGPGATASFGLVSSLARIIPTQQTTLTVTAQDAWGNRVPTYAGTVALSFTPAGDVTYDGAHTFNATDAGSYAFTAYWSSPGLRTVQASDGSLSSQTVGVNVLTATTLAELIFTLPAAPVRAGSSFPVTLTAVNAAGEVLESFWDTVQVRGDGCGFTDFNFYGLSGVLTQTIECAYAGSIPLIANFADADFGISTPVTVIAGTPYRLVLVDSPPATVIAGAPFNASFRLEDVNGNTANPAEHAEPLVLGLSVTGPVLAGSTPVIVNNIITYPSLTVSAYGDDVQVTASTNGLEVNFAATNTFRINEGSGCPVAYVRNGGAGDGCTSANPAPSITAALGRVDDGGKVLVGVGTYAEQVLIGKTVTLRGGYDPATFAESTRNPLLLTKIKPGVDTPSAVETINPVTATIDGFYIGAADPSGSLSATRAVLMSGGASVTLQNNRIIGPVFDSAVDQASAIEIGIVDVVTIRNNWIHSGGATSGRAIGVRHAITGSTYGQVTAYVVHNTIYVADADSGEAFLDYGIGNHRFTNNLIIGDFARCGVSDGVCAVREQVGDSSRIDSMQNNYVMQLNGPVPEAYIYTDYNGFAFTSMNTGTANASGNVTATTGLPQAAFVRFTEHNFETDDWHLTGQRDFGIARDATTWSCGQTANAACGGNGADIDGQVRTNPICVGADENDGL